MDIFPGKVYGMSPVFSEVAHVIDPGFGKQPGDSLSVVFTFAVPGVRIDNHKPLVRHVRIFFMDGRWQSSDHSDLPSLQGISAEPRF
jgi:hypothetical protein